MWSQILNLDKRDKLGNKKVITEMKTLQYTLLQINSGIGVLESTLVYSI